MAASDGATGGGGGGKEAGEGGAGLVLPPTTPSDPGTPPTTRTQHAPGRRVSAASSTASGASLASLLAKLHHPPSSSLSLEGKLRIRATLDCGSDVLGCRFSPDGALVGAALRSGQVKLFTLAGTLSHTLQVPGEAQRATPAATSVVWVPGAQAQTLITTYSDGRVVAWRGRSVGVEMGGAGVDVRAAAVSGLEGQVVTFTREQVTLRDVNTLAPALTLDPGVGGHLVGRGPLWAVCGRGREVIGGGCGLTWWDARTGAATRSVGGVQVRGPALASNTHSGKVLSGSWGGGQDSVKVWDSSTGKLTHVLHSEAAHTSVYCVAWVGKDTVVVGGTDPNLLRLTTLDNTTVGVMRGLRQPLWCVDAHVARPHQGTRLALASGSTLYLLDVLK
ncbi:hypothetical protein O3P69_020569 [Scylla paramamosain]